MNKNLIAVLAATTMSASIAAVSITGDYEGILTDGNPGAATYTQDLDLTMIGSAGDSSVTVKLDNLTGGSAVTTSEAWIDTKLEGLNFKGGNYKGQNGLGLLQSSSAAANQFEVNTSVGGASLTLGQSSGDSNATVDTSMKVAGVDVTMQNVTSSDRFITVVSNFFGFGTTIETQKTATGRNLAVAADATLGNALTLTGVYMDVKDASVVTQDDGIVGDVSDANTGSTVKGVVASTDTAIGELTGKYVIKNNKNSITAEVTRGVWTLGHTKSEDTDGVTTAKINANF